MVNFQLLASFQCSDILELVSRFPLSVVGREMQKVNRSRGHEVMRSRVQEGMRSVGMEEWRNGGEEVRRSEYEEIRKTERGGQEVRR